MWILNKGHCFRNQVLNVCEAHRGKGEKRYKLKEDFFAYGASSLSNDLSEEIVFVGHGIGHVGR